MSNVYLGDCLEIMPEIPDNSVDLLVTDMPYDLFDFTWLKIGFSKLKNNGSVYVITDYRSVAELKLSLDKLGVFRNWIVWCYRGIARHYDSFQANHDDILFYTKSDTYIWNQPYEPPSESTIKRWGKYADKNGVVPFDKLTPSMQKHHKSMSIRETRMRDWWTDISVVGYKEAPKGKYHIYQKPLALIERIILASSQDGNLVLDCFAGSGTTGVACQNLNRDYILIEKDPKYYDIIMKRLE